MGIEDEQARHDDRRNADRYVDVENPAPTVAVGEPATKNGAEERRDDDAESPEAHGFAAIFGREGFEEHGLRNWLEATTARSLNDAANDKEGQAWRESAKERRNCEAGDGHHEHALATEVIGEPAGERKNDGV